MNSIHPFNDEQVHDEPRRPWDFWKQQQANILQAALECDEEEWRALGRVAWEIYEED